MELIIPHILVKVIEGKNYEKLLLQEICSIKNEIIFEIEEIYYPHSSAKLSVYTYYYLSFKCKSQLCKLQFSKDSLTVFCY